MASPFSSSSSTSTSSSSLHSKSARARTLPRRGQIKAAIFASIFRSIAHFLGAKGPKESANAASSRDGVGLHRSMSDLRLDVDGGLSPEEGGRFGLSVRSSPTSMSTGSITPNSLSSKRVSSGSMTPNSSFERLSRPRSFHEGMHRKG